MEDGINSQDEMLVEITPSLAILDRMTTLERTTWLISSERLDPSNRCGPKPDLVLVREAKAGIETAPRWRLWLTS
jgi:hypothetical protein